MPTVRRCTAALTRAWHRASVRLVALGLVMVLLSLAGFVAAAGLVAGLAGLVWLLRRGHRLPVLTLLVAATVVVVQVGPDGPYALALILCSDAVVGLMAAVETPRRAKLAAAGTAVVQGALSLNGFLVDQLLVISLELLVLLTAWTIGNSVRQRRIMANAERHRAEVDAVQAERLRIARELHDMIAHSFGVISVQAGMGRRVIDTQPEQARNALAAIEDTSRDTAAALRRMLGTLRRADPGSGPDPREPTPGLADLDALIARAAQGGVRVSLRWDGERPALPPDIDLSAYRIVQESVTNVIRHAGTDHCEVVITSRPGALAIEVTDAGRGGPASFGYGLSGMRERVSLLGGEFEAGPVAGGGFRISARIPLPALSGHRS